MKSTPLPASTEDIGGELYRRLGTYWTRFSTDRELIRRLCDGDALLGDQLNLDFLEAVATLGRRSIPAFHRRLWTPYLLRRSDRQQGGPFIIGMDPQVVLGPQPAGAGYVAGASPVIGGAIQQPNTTSYPLVVGPDDGLLRICDSPFSPSVELVRGFDYYLQDGRVFFDARRDPFDSGRFPAMTTVGTDGTTDIELIIWAADAMFDYAGMYNAFGVAAGYRENSSEHYSAIVNALLDLRFGSATISLFNRAVGTIAGTPVTGDTDEVVEEVLANSDGSTTVVTDKQSYRTGTAEVLLPGVVVDAVLPPGSFLTDTIRIYPKPGMLDSSDKFLAANGLTLTQFQTDVPKLKLPRGLMGSYSIDSGLTADWAETGLLFAGYDSNGNPKLWFQLDGDPADVASYWSAVWANAERRNESLASAFGPYITDPAFSSPVVGALSPLNYFLSNFMRSNTHVLVMDLDRIPSYIGSLSALAGLPALIPAHNMLLLVAKQTVPADTYALDGAIDLIAFYYGVRLGESATAGLPSTAEMTYRDFVTTSWVKA